MSELRPELPQITERIATLPVHRGYPVPWFVSWIDNRGRPLQRGDGTPDFRVIHPGAAELAYWRSLCWICGQPRDQHAAFVIGPMCAVNRLSAEPPSHPECAGWAACACPFLVRPHARRREGNMPEDAREPAGIGIRRNPGVALVWASSTWTRFRAPDGGWLFNIGDPAEILWLAEGRLAHRAEVEESIRTGLPALQELADLQGPEACAALARDLAYVEAELIPA
jgi:hypothetical protein